MLRRLAALLVAGVASGHWLPAAAQEVEPDVHLTTLEAQRSREALDEFLDTDVRAGDHVTLQATSEGVRRSARIPQGLVGLHAWVAERRLGS